jgi:Flp pilus assembly protein TadD
MLAFAELFEPTLGDAARAEQARKTARRALALAPHHPRATTALALAEEALGDAAEGRRLVLAALEEHPASEVLRKALGRLSRPKAG